MPQDTLDIEIDGKREELHMSFGLLNELLAIVGDLPNISMIGLKPDLRNSVLYAVLSGRDDKGLIPEGMGYNPFQQRVSPTDVLKIVQWVSEHTLSFFLNAMEQNLKVHRAHQGALSSMASGSGSQT